MGEHTAAAEARRLTSQGQERKQQLLEHAARLFAERGYDETRIIDICRAAGVAKGLFYWYFENKEELFSELAEEIRRRLRRAQSRAIDPSASPLTRLRQGTEASVHFIAEHAPFFALFEVERIQNRFVDVMQKGTDVHVSDSARLIREAIAAGQIPDEDPTILARGIVGVVAVYSHFHRTGRTDLPVDELGRFVARFVIRSLGADEATVRGAMQDTPAGAPAG